MCLLDHAGKVFNAHLVKRYGGVSTLPSSKELMLAADRWPKSPSCAVFRPEPSHSRIFPDGRSEPGRWRKSQAVEVRPMAAFASGLLAPTDKHKREHH
jgi:hypothetical protein